MTTVGYPSEVVPGPPPVTLDMPDGWTQVWVPETLIAIRDDAPGGHFLANVVVRFHQRLGDFGPEEVRAELSGHAAQRRDGELGPLEQRDVDGREWVGADLAFVDDEAGSVGQVHWFSARSRDDVTDVIQVTGSYARSRRDTDYATIDAIIDTIRVHP